MLRNKTRLLLATAGVAGVLGTGVAVAAGTQPACPYGNVPQPAQTQTRDQTQDRDQTRLVTRDQLRKRDGTGPRHEQRSQQRGTQQQGRHQGPGNGPGTGNPSCPYRS